MTDAERIAERVFTLTRADLVRYAGASGDHNPIHWSDSHARQVGLDEVIAHGMLTLATAVRAVTDWSGDPGTVGSIRARFTRAVPVPDRPGGAAVTVTGAATPDEGGVAVALTVTCDGVAVLSGARVVLARPAGERAG